MGFDPKQPRNEDGEWVSMYHGTEKSRVKSILKTGLSTAESNYKGQIFLSKSKNLALRHAQMRAVLTEDAPAVVRVSVPKVIASEFKRDTSHPKNAFISERPIPPGWIKYGKKK